MGALSVVESDMTIEGLDELWSALEPLSWEAWKAETALKDAKGAQEQAEAREAYRVASAAHGNAYDDYVAKVTAWEKANPAERVL